MKYLVLVFVSVLSIGMTSCKNDKKAVTEEAVAYQCPMKCEGDKTYDAPGNCPVCNMELKQVGSEESIIKVDKNSGEISDISIFNLTSTWTNQDGKDMKLADLKGDVLVMVMIYTSCKAACPRLAADMRNIEERLPAKTKGKVKMILVSIDPKTDTHERLKAFAKENVMDKEPFTFLRSNEDDTRELSAVLAVNYKKISPLDFSHSNIISVFNAQGEMVFQQEGLGVNSDATLQHIEDSVNQIE